MLFFYAGLTGTVPSVSSVADYRGTVPCESFSLEIHVPAVALGPYGEVNPDGGAALLQNQLIKVKLLTIRDIQQDTGIAYGLFFTRAVDIYRATRQMVRVGCPAAELIHLRRPKTTIDHDGALL